jgi:membrane carboxypeptidase/penicillin-binding protein
MEKVLQETQGNDFQLPDNVTLVRMDARSGLLANGKCGEIVEAAFIEGTEPVEYCPEGADQQLEKFR